MSDAKQYQDRDFKAESRRNRKFRLASATSRKSVPAKMNARAGLKHKDLSVGRAGLFLTSAARARPDSGGLPHGSGHRRTPLD